MLKRMAGSMFLSVAALLGAALGCGSGEDPRAPQDEDVDAPAQTELAPAANPEPSDVRYRFVDTADGMTVEATSSEQVQTLSCPTQTCGGMCGECAAAACRLLGGAQSLCQALAADCESVCSCAEGRCGFPVCVTDRQICYEGAAQPSEPSPRGPEPDPSPFDNSFDNSFDNAATPAGASASNASAPQP